ncbi:MAG: matrixin family metalloprotease [Candidatus Aenigmatarchaeota archaeon]
MKKLLVLATVLIVLTTATFAKYKEPLDSITFIHYKNGAVKIVGIESKAQLCYKLMGIKWKSFPINYVISPMIDSSAIIASTNEWDKYTSTNLFGSYEIDGSANFDSSPDGRNEYSYGNYPQSGVIAVTRTWYTRKSKEIVEYDVMFDSDFKWGDATKDPTVMDWQNIATHETGHGIGLADLYTSVCSEQTMYGYSDYGETKKRTLEYGDIAGLQRLYGS